MSGVPVILVRGETPLGLTDRIVRGALYCSASSSWLMRDQKRVSASPTVRRFFIMLAANAPGEVSEAFAIDQMWGHLPSGGPDDAAASIGGLVHDVRIIGAALGFRIERRRGFGLRAIAVDAAVTPSLDSRLSGA